MEGPMEDNGALSSSEGEVEMEDPEQEEFCGKENINVYVNTLFTYLLEGTKVCNDLPVGEEYNYQQAFRAFPREMGQYSKVLLQMISDSYKRSTNKTVSLQSKKDESERLETVVEIVDKLIENTDMALDEYKSKRGKKVLGVKRMLTETKKISSVLRPQVRFFPQPDNSNTPFRVKIYKDGKLTYGEPEIHYFAQTINSWLPDPSQLKPRPEQIYNKLEDTPLHWVDTVPKLQDMIKKLMNCPEIAVDIEQHDYRSFQGFICLLQLSSRDEDFIVDALELRDNLHILQPLFGNPNIVKIMHGASNDVVWLQRDFGVYVVNLFDTHEASKLLNYPSGSLAYLMKSFCGITANKVYQTSDWRIRPLPEAMMRYAREDTHYLLYIYDRLKALLAQSNTPEKNLIQEVFMNSKQICLRKYEKELFGKDVCSSFLEKRKISTSAYTSQELEIIRSLLKWRDQTARAEDESTAYVLPANMLLKIVSTKPTTPNKLVESCNPLPQLVHRDAQLLVSLIQKAIQETSNGPSDTKSKPTNTNSGTSSPEPCDAFITPINTSIGSRTSNSSPVLTTEQLYQSALWTESENTDPSSIAHSLKPPAQLTPSSSCLAAFQQNLSAEHGGSDYLPKSFSSKVEGPSSSLFQSFSEGSSCNPRVDFSKLFPQNDAARVTDSFYSESPPPQSRLFMESPVMPPTPPETPSLKNEDRVPASLNEIYSLSKQNKKRNKDKKKLKEDSVTDSAPAFSSDVKSDGEVGQDPMGFMQKIGWITTDNIKEIQKEISAQSQTQAPGTTITPSTNAHNLPKPQAPTGKPPAVPTYIPQPHRPSAPITTTTTNTTRQPKQSGPKASLSANGSFIPYDYSQGQAPFNIRKANNTR